MSGKEGSQVDETDLEDRDAGNDETMLIVSRRLYTQDAFDRRYSQDAGTSPSLTSRIRESCKCSRKNAWNILSMYFPILNFTRTYKIRKYALGDFLSGLTVSFMHLPQAMGFGILASLRPEHGLYSTFFPVLIYVFFGTSPHISFGTNAVMALLTQTVVDREAEVFAANYHGHPFNSTEANTTQYAGPSEEELLAVRVNAAAACSLLVGIFLTGMGLLRFGFLTTYMSDSFIGGFTTAAAIHISTSQVPKIFGIKVNAYSGAGKIVLTYIDLFRKIGQTVAAEVIIAIISMAVLLIVKICINERYAKKLKMPVPIDLIVVVVGTFISHFAKFKDKFSVTTVGPIPARFASPFVPNLDNAGSYVSEAFVMAILSLAMSIAMAKLTAKMHGVQINDNQELVAYGTSNLIPGFFSCFPAATAPPRTMILSSLGAKTTLNGIPTAIFMLLVILLIGQLFVSLPLSVLAAMIIVSMKELLLQYRSLPNIWRVNKYDFIIWVTTNSIGVLVDLNYGLIAGIGISILLVVIQTQLTPGTVLVRSRAEDVLLDGKMNKQMQQTDAFKIFRFNTGLYFATKERFKSELYNKVLNPQRFKKEDPVNQEVALSVFAGSTLEINGHKYAIDDEPRTSDKPELKGLSSSDRGTVQTRFVILDCSALNYMDIGGKNMLQQVIKEYKEIGVTIVLAKMPRQALCLLENSDFFKTFPKDNLFFELHDAVEQLDRNMTETTTNSSV